MVAGPKGMSLLHDRAVLNAAHTCWASVYAGEYEERGGRFPAGCCVCDEVEPLGDHEQLPIIWRYLGRIEQAWGHEVGLILWHMGLRSVAQQSHALTLLLLGCMGHGVGLGDEWAEEFERACESLGMISANESPILFEPEEWRMLAEGHPEAIAH